MSIKKSNRTRDLPAYNAVPQPAAPPAACPLCYLEDYILEEAARKQCFCSTKWHFMDRYTKFRRNTFSLSEDGTSIRGEGDTRTVKREFISCDQLRIC